MQSLVDQFDGSGIIFVEGIDGKGIIAEVHRDVDARIYENDGAWFSVDDGGLPVAAKLVGGCLAIVLPLFDCLTHVLQSLNCYAIARQLFDCLAIDPQLFDYLARCSTIAQQVFDCLAID
ncbi:hypothetical protein CCP4SC76_3290001 [Gammaproteobacteria bacterium]